MADGHALDGEQPILHAGEKVLTRQDASTGWMIDVSPSQVAAVLAYSGRNTVFGLGTDGGIWYRTDYSFAGWTAMPRTTTSGAVLTATSGPAAVSSDNGASVDVVVRGTDGGYWWTTEIRCWWKRRRLWGR